MRTGASVDSAASRGSALVRGSTASGLLLFALVVWLLATGRWGSYVGVPDAHIFISEVTLAAVALLALVEHLRRARAGDDARIAPMRGPWMLLTLLLSWSILRFLVGWDFRVDALRDFAPYGYALVAFAAALRPVRGDVARRLALAALVGHTAWVSAVHYSLFPPGVVLPAWSRTSLFDLRTDFDTTVCGVTAAWCVYLAVQNPRLVVRLVLLPFAAFNAWLVFNLLSRGGLIASLTGFLFLSLVVATPAMSWARRSFRNAAIAVLVVAAGITGLAVLTATSATGARLLSTFDFDDSQPRVQDGAAFAGGTTKARLRAYELVVAYTVPEPERLAVGVGFGPNFLRESGAAAMFEGTFTGVRAPHNILVNSLARLGVLGALLHAAVLGAGAWMAWRFFVGRRPSTLSALSALVVVTVAVAALVGVVLESPFGAIPYFWCYGWLATRRDLPPARPAARRAVSQEPLAAARAG